MGRGVGEGRTEIEGGFSYCSFHFVNVLISAYTGRDGVWVCFLHYSVSRPHTARLGSYHTLLQSQLLETRPTHGLTTVGNLPRTTCSLEHHCTNISLDWRRGKIVWTSTRSAPTWLDFGFWVWRISLVILYLASHALMPFGRLGEGLRPSPRR
jgi:hypothetical protein